MNYKNRIFLLLLCAALLLTTGCSIKTSTENTTTYEDTTSNIVRVTFPEGYTVSEMATRLEENNVCSAQEFLSECNNIEYLQSYGYVIDNPEERTFILEGYLYPDTYDFFIGESVPSVIKKFLNNTTRKLTTDMFSRAEELGYSMDEILRIASIIEEETYYKSELNKVSSVLHNRLNSTQFARLQCDVTIFYLKNHVKPYVSNERYEEIYELYNTYKCNGLPAGPITNSSIDSINAALYPESTDYYYFVTDSEKNYLYAETWEQHQKNCASAGISQ